MTAAAGFPLFHLVHAKMFVTASRNIEIRMAIFAAVSGNMNLMTEFSTARAEPYLFNDMAFLAIRFHAEGSFCVVAGAARTTFFHIGHAVSNAIFATFENFIVALGTFIHTFMGSMIKSCCSGLFNLESDING